MTGVLEVRAKIAMACELLAAAARDLDEHEKRTERNERQFFTTRRGEGPPGFSHRCWRALAKSIPGARRHGRWFVVSVEAFDRWMDSRGQGQGCPTVTSKWSPRAALAEAGIDGTGAPTMNGSQSTSPRALRGAS